MTPAATKIHRFEQSGLGHAPFRFIRYEVHKFCAAPGAPILPGSTCQFCGTPIMGVYYLRGADPADKEFKVGCECVKKTGDEGLKRVIAEVERERRSDDLKTRVSEAISKASDPATFDRLKLRPHPNSWHAENGKSLWDWCMFVLQFGGESGKRTACKIVESA